MERLTYNKDLYKNKKDLIPIILQKDKELYDYNTNGNNGKYSFVKAKKMWLELNNLYKEINQANNIYYHENKWIDKYCKDIFNKNSGLTGEKLIDYVANTLNKLDGIVVRLIDDKDICKDKQYYTKLHNYEIFVITANKTYSYYINRGYAGQFVLKPNGQNWTNNKFIIKHPCELLYDGINLNDSIYNNFLKK